jgi:hypothetical protein
VVHLDSRISPRIFEKIRNGLNGILWGWGETDSRKKPEAKNLVTLSLYGTVRPDQIWQRVKPLDSPLLRHQPLYVLDFFI